MKDPLAKSAKDAKKKKQLAREEMNDMERLILASASPRRAMLLRQIGVDFIQVASDIGEEAIDASDAAHMVISLSKRKVDAVRRGTEERWVLGADTAVVLDGLVLGKPQNSESAARMLSMLSGRAHRVLTGLALCDGDNESMVSEVEETVVWMRQLDQEEITAYVRTGEPMGKAGAYAIQGLGATLVERIHGCYFNVVGLPIVRLLRMMRTMQYPYYYKIRIQADREVEKGSGHENVQ